MELPSYDQLPIDSSKPPRSAWGLWGEDDQLGAVNLLTAESVLDGVRTVAKGAVFPLNWDLEMPDPPLYDRQALKHTVFPQYSAQDEFYDSFYPQASSQWDSLCHVGHPDHGFYNGRGYKDFTGGPDTKNGIEQWARRGIVGRGVLLDIARYKAHIGAPIDASQTYEITAADLQNTLEWHGLELRRGDILIIRTGWIEWYLQTDEAVRRDLASESLARLRSPGLEASEDTLRFLWDNHVSAAAADNPAFEAWPHALDPGTYLHFDMLGLLGIPIGELWFLEDLAADCAADGRYDFLLTSAPLNKLGGVGSPPNALAIK